MSLNAVQQYIKSQLDGLPSAQAENAVAQVLPPVVGDFAEAPQIYIWGSDDTEKREAMSGRRTAAVGTAGAGRRVAVRYVDIWIKYAVDSELSIAGSALPILIDAVLQKLRSPALPFDTTDPDTHVVTHITDYGEEFDVTYGEVHALQEQSKYWVFEAHIRMRVREYIDQ